jgi:hypothetical protein
VEGSLGTRVVEAIAAQDEAALADCFLDDRIERADVLCSGFRPLR